MVKNILIFSDGTGQAGGITFDEDRTNIYKLYRATRCGPDTCIDPSKQVAFYDPGLGSPADGSFIFATPARRLYNLASQGTGLGLTANIIDCYAALIRLYEDGDRIFLFGFSRGAYTVRSLAGVLAKCGIPRHLPGGDPLPLDIDGSTKLAASAVKNVYQFCSSTPRTDTASYGNFLLDSRDLIAKRFRQDHGCGHAADDTRPNVDPYFIGVFDTVAALGRYGALLIFALLTIGSLLGLSAVISGLSWFDPTRLPWWLQWFGLVTFENVLTFFLAMAAGGAALAFFENYVKFSFKAYQGRDWWKNLLTLHIAPPKQKFTDINLNPRIGYAKHAISIDENRKDFKRVAWRPTGPRAEETPRDAEKNIYFEQVWFAGVHADIGGGYRENEARLSDASLRWMLAAASIIPNGILHNPSLLCLFPNSAGPQHDEYKAGTWQYGERELPTNKAGVSFATMHHSVYERFKALGGVVQYDRKGDYRPNNLRTHVDFAHYFSTGGKPPQNLQCVADNIEAKWAKARTSQ